MIDIKINIGKPLPPEPDGPGSLLFKIPMTRDILEQQMQFLRELEIEPIRDTLRCPLWEYRSTLCKGVNKNGEAQ